MYSNENKVRPRRLVINSLENVKPTAQNLKQITKSFKLKVTDYFGKHTAPFGDISNIRISHDLDHVSIPVSSGFVDKNSGYKITSLRTRSPCERSLVATHEKLSSITVPCLQPVEELRQLCKEMSLTFVNCSNNVYLGKLIVHGSKPVCCLKRCTVKCLQSYEDLENICEKMNLKFINVYLGNLIVHGLKPDHNLKRCTVKCLQSYEDLENMCEKRNLKFIDGKTYEVDLLYEDSFEEGETYYFVKWKGYASKYNTWEPESNLIGCQDLIKHYKALQRSDISLKDVDLFFFIRELFYRKPYDFLSMRRLCGLLMGVSHRDRTIHQFTLTELRKKAREIHNLPVSKFVKLKDSLVELIKFSEARKKVLVNLKEWEEEINISNVSAYIEVENNEDLEEPPRDFKFIHDYVSNDVDICEEPVAFCQCEDCYKCKRQCCPVDSEAPFAYTIHRRLQLLPGYPIFECNKRCRCGPDCINRVVQHGQKVRVAIFRTSYGCGWGLKTLEVIQKDQFVLEYLGEVLTSEAAEARGKIYDNLGRSYLFDLDFNSENNLYTIDAGHVGNASHFINHSCEPNLHVFAVWINQPDPYLPRLAFFAKKKIEKGEELTFDYKMVKNSDRFESSEDLPVERIPCRCNSKKCRKFLF